jgi:hypothetical protein
MASLTSSILKGLMMASIFFMVNLGLGEKGWISPARAARATRVPDREVMN